MTVFNYRVKQRGHYADHSYEAVISCVVILFSQCETGKSGRPAGRSARVIHQHGTAFYTRKHLNHSPHTSTVRLVEPDGETRVRIGFDIFILRKLWTADRPVEGADGNPLIHIVYRLHDIVHGRIK